jgi:hypothetical protein
MSETAKRKGFKKRAHQAEDEDDTEEALGVQRKLKKNAKKQKH